jgi:hypothetical protein
LVNFQDFRPDEWEIKRENVVIGERIGSGCFAEVHKGKVKLKDQEYIDCAIKVIPIHFNYTRPYFYSKNSLNLVLWF